MLRAIAVLIAMTAALLVSALGSAAERNTTVSIRAAQFFINSNPTYQGRTWNGHPIEGLLLNSRMVQGIFDDLNPETPVCCERSTARESPGEMRGRRSSGIRR